MLIALFSTTSLILVVLLIVLLQKYQALRLDRQALCALAENNPDLIFRYDRLGRQVYVNPAVTRLFRMPFEDIVGRSPADCPFLNSTQKGKMVDSIRRVFETGEMSEMEVALTDPEGQRRSFNMLLIPECNTEGQVETVLGLNREITAIRDAERFVSNLIAQQPGFIYKFRMTADGHMSYPFASPRVEEFFGLKPEDIVHDATPLHAMTHPEDAPRVLESILESARTMSSSHVEYRLLRPGYPERWMNVVANPELEVDGSVLWSGIFLDITKRKRMEDELAYSQNFLNHIIEVSADPIWVKDRGHRWIHFNEAFCRFVGGTREELIGKSNFDFYPVPEACVSWEGDEVAFNSGEEFSREEELTNRLGEKRYLLTRKTTFNDSHGNPILVGVGSDITERKRMEDELADSQNFLDRIINATIEPLFVKDRQHRWILVNDAFCDLLGSTREELIGNSDFDYFPEDEARVFWQDEELIFTEGKEFLGEEEFTTKGGEKRYVFTRKRVFNDVHGNLNITGVVTNITERKRMELLLATRERELRTLMENIPDIIVRSTPDARYLYTNPVQERITGKRNEDLLGKTVMECFPDGRYAEIERRVIAAGTSGSYDEMEMEVLVADGEVEYHLLRFIPERDEKDEVVSVLTIGTDITERKLAEEKLRLAASVFTNINEGIVITDADNRILKVNAAFTRITGYTREEVVGENPCLLSSGHLAPEFFDEMWRSLNQTGHWVGEIWNRRKNGEKYTEWLTISAVNDEQGKLSHYVAVFADISKIKEQERQLQLIAYYDALTGLPNRLLFLDRLKQAVAQAQRCGGLLAMCYGDLDGFKSVNDRYGHEAGDNVLVTIGKRMQESVRACDTVGRIGGDEFVILLMGLENFEECGMVLTRVVDSVAQPIQLDGHSVSLSTSLGVALFPQNDADPDMLFQHADQAMYQAKQTGKNIIRFFDPNQR